LAHTDLVLLYLLRTILTLAFLGHFVTPALGVHSENCILDSYWILHSSWKRSER
jgi:hypothetical protein